MTVPIPLIDDEHAAGRTARRHCTGYSTASPTHPLRAARRHANWTRR
ncbi:hypothetical protein ABZ079_28180 [Streptomyces sp. NPDC006314]